MNYLNSIKILLLAVVLFSVTNCFARDINFEAVVNKDKVSLGENIVFSLIFRNAKNFPVQELPKIEGFESRYLGPATQISIINGKTQSTLAHNYILTPLKIGTFKIGPISVKYKGKTYTSKEITIEVVEGKTGEKEKKPEEKAEEKPKPKDESRDEAFTI